MPVMRAIFHRVIDPDQVRERWLALQEEAAVAELRERCETAAVEEQVVPFSWWVYHPQPFAREMAGADPRHGSSSQLARLGLDAVGRPVVQHLRYDLFQLYDWAKDHCDVVEVNGSLRKLQRFGFVDGALAEEVSTEGHRRLDGRPAVQVTRWLYEDDRPSLVIETEESGAHPYWGGPERGPYWRAKAYTFAYDAVGELATITSFLGARDYADGGDADDAQAAARAGFPADFDGRPLYDARTQRWETDLPAPDRAFDGLSEPLADALFAAVEAQRGALEPLEFVLVGPGGFPSQAVAADAAFLDRALGMGNDVLEVLRVACEAPQGCVLVDAIDTAPPEVLQRLRAGRQAFAGQSGSTADEDLKREVLVTLNARTWLGVAPTFLVVTFPSNQFDLQDDGDRDDEPFSFSQEELFEIAEAYTATLDPALSSEAAAQAHDDHLRSLLDAVQPPARRRPALPDLENSVGRDRLDAFLERLSRPVDASRARDELLPQSREELAALLTDVGLTTGEASRIVSDALWGILLEPGGTGQSRLGGAPVLPAGTPWPRAEGRPLTHLGTIALDELPAVDGREQLPDDGLLSFFADTGDEGAFIEPVEPAGEWGHDLVAVIHTPAGRPTHEPTPPGEALVEQRVSPVGRLQLRHLGFGCGNRLFGIDALAENAVQTLTKRVNGSISHQLLGYPWPVQDDPRQPGQIVLFHIADDPDLNFSFIDAGDIHFLGTPEDIEACRWDQLTVWPNSC